VGNATQDALVIIADRLYALPVRDFIPARDEAAQQAGELGAAVKTLRKPSTSAWLINQLARRSAERLDQLVDLGAALRSAAGRGDSTDLRELSNRRRRLVRDVADSAAKLNGPRVGDAIDREIVSTLDAAVIDEAAAAAVRSGRLIRALTASGFEPIDLDGAVALPDSLPQLPAPRRLRAVAAPQPRAPRTPARAEEPAERIALAKRALVKSEADLSRAQQRYDVARARVLEAEAALADARSNLAEAGQARASAKKARDSAARRARG